MIKHIFREKKLRTVFLLAVGLLIAFILYGCLAPVRLTITELPSPWYGDIHLDNSNTDVKNVSLFGVKTKAKDVYGRQMPNGLITVWSKGLSYETKADIIAPTDTKITYDGDGVYVGQPVDASKIRIKAFYDDLERNVTWFQVSEDAVPLSSEVSIPIQLTYGTMQLNVKTIQPKEIRAEYAEDCQMGDVFNRDAVNVRIVYTDDTEYELSDFMIPDVPKYISDDTEMTIVTDYGNTTLKIVPENAQKLSISYDVPLYVGDIIEPNHIKMMMGEKEIAASDFTHIDDVGILKTHAEVLVCSKYGNAVLKVDPIGIKSCKPIIDGEVIEHQIPLITGIDVIYEDDTVVNLIPTEYEITSVMDSLPSGKSKVWFLYHTLYLHFDISAIPQSVLDLREFDVNLPVNTPTYNLSDDEIQTIGVLCQRLASDDLKLVAAEASLLANRFELYGTGHLVNYMLTSGYWGADAADYVRDHDVNETVLYVIQDVLVNGHRTLPLYVDERQIVNSGDIFVSGDSITKENGTVYGFYSFPSQDNPVAYGYTSYAASVYGGVSGPSSDMNVQMDSENVDGDILFNN